MKINNTMLRILQLVSLDKSDIIMTKGYHKRRLSICRGDNKWGFCAGNVCIFSSLTVVRKVLMVFENNLVNLVALLIFFLFITMEIFVREQIKQIIRKCLIVLVRETIY